MIKVVHTGDFHLDGSFFLEDPRLNELRKKERRALFANLMMFLRDRKVDILLLCGDLLDGLAAEKESLELIVREFENTPDTKIVIAPGRNDPCRPGSFYAERFLPSNVFVFKSDRLSSFEFDDLNVTVYGYAFTGRNMEKNPFAVMPPVKSERINLLCGYGTLENGEGDFDEKDCCPIRLSEIGNTGVDYVALGGRHDESPLSSEKGVYYSYAGAPEGCDFGQWGHRGIRILAIEKQDGKCALGGKTVRFSRRHYEKKTVDVSSYDKIGALINDLSDEMKSSQYDADTILLLELVGKTTLQFGVIDESLFEKLKSRIYHLKVCDRTEIVFERNPDAKDMKEGFATALLDLSKDEERIAGALKIGLAALEGKSF
ncbi:MAG: metallophosphoesterase [Clostridia bacterium]|nr:metallophosphoesterase [Clostridia bacterium]